MDRKRLMAGAALEYAQSLKPLGVHRRCPNAIDRLRWKNHQPTRLQHPLRPLDSLFMMLGGLNGHRNNWHPNDPSPRV